MILTCGYDVRFGDSTVVSLASLLLACLCRPWVARKGPLSPFLQSNHILTMQCCVSLSVPLMKCVLIPVCVFVGAQQSASAALSHWDPMVTEYDATCADMNASTREQDSAPQLPCADDGYSPWLVRTLRCAVCVCPCPRISSRVYCM